MNRSDGGSQSWSARAAHAVRWNVITFPVSAGASLLTSVAITRGVDTPDYAAFVFLTSLSQIIVAVSDLGLSVTISRFVPEIEAGAGAEGLRRFVGAMLLIRIAAVLLTLTIAAVLLFTNALVVVGGYPAALSLGLVAAVTLPHSLWVVLLYVHYGRISQRAASLIQLAGVCVQLIATLVSLAAGLGVPGLLAAAGIAAVVQLLLGGLSIARQLHAVGTALEPHGSVGVGSRRLVKLAAASYADKLTSAVGSFTFLALLVANTTTPTAYAAFGLSVTVLAQFASVLAVPLNALLLPLFANIRVHGNERTTSQAQRSAVRAYGLMFLTAGGAIAALAPAAIPLLYGSRYVVAVPFVQWMCVLGALELTVSPIGIAVLFTRERYRNVYAARVVVILATFAAAIVAVRADLLTACAIYAGSRVVVAWILMSPGLPLSSWLDAKFVIRVAATTIAAWALPGIVVTSSEPNWSTLAFAGALGACMFLLLFIVMGGIRRADREILMRVVRGEPSRSA